MTDPEDSSEISGDESDRIDDGAEFASVPPPRDRGMIIAVGVVIVALVAIGVGNFIHNATTDSAADDDSSSYTDDYVDETTTTIDACHDKAASIMGALDSGESSVQVYAEFGGMQDAETKALLPLYYRWQARAVQVGADTATDELADAIDVVCA
jgi:hypothetical protein